MEKSQEDAIRKELEEKRLLASRIANEIKEKEALLGKGIESRKREIEEKILNRYFISKSSSQNYKASFQIFKVVSYAIRDSVTFVLDVKPLKIDISAPAAKMYLKTVEKERKVEFLAQLEKVVKRTDREKDFVFYTFQKYDYTTSSQNLTENFTNTWTIDTFFKRFEEVSKKDYENFMNIFLEHERTVTNLVLNFLESKKVNVGPALQFPAYAETFLMPNSIQLSVSEADTLIMAHEAFANIVTANGKLIFTHDEIYSIIERLSIHKEIKDSILTKIRLGRNKQFSEKFGL